METLLDKIRLQYEKYPYPEFPWLATIRADGMAHASYEAGASLIFQHSISSIGKRIALLGCGTFEPYAFGTTHRGAHITAVDLSYKTLEIARRRCRFFLTRNVKFQRDDITGFSKNTHETFDYIHCYGVLHHMDQPEDGFKAIAKLLRPNGFARIMIYSKSHRRRTQMLRDACNILQLDPGNKDSIALFQKMVGALPLTHPLRLTYELNSDREFKSGVVDAFLNACENPLSVDELSLALNAAGLTIHAWDFSRNLQNVIAGGMGQNVVEKLRMLESFDQWPAGYTFWVSKRPLIQKSQQVFIRKNPLVKASSFTNSLYSGLLRQEIKISRHHRLILAATATEAIPKKEMEKESGFQKPLRELTEARFVLEVSS